MPRHEQYNSCSSDFFAFTFRAGFLEAAFSLAFIVDEGGVALPFSLPEGWVDTLRERVVRMLAAAAAAVAARVGMGAVIERTTRSGEKKNFFFQWISDSACDRRLWSSWSSVLWKEKYFVIDRCPDDGGGRLRRMPNESQS
jgi:hypothetical protein